MNIQFKKGVLELCVLSLLSRGDRYGYEIAQAFSGELDISDGTVYPILRRLKLDGYVSSYLEEPSGGPPRKYYTLTNHGKEFAALLLDEWRRFQRQVNDIVNSTDTADEPPRTATAGSHHMTGKADRYDKG